MRHAIFAAAALVWSASAATATPLPLGFEALHWGMTPQQAADAMPLLHDALVPNATTLPAAGQVVRVRVPGYVWRDCTLVVSLGFSSGELVNLRATQSGASRACRNDVLAAMNEAYGVAKSASSANFSDYMWTGDGATTPRLDVDGKSFFASGFDVSAHLRKTGVIDIDMPSMFTPVNTGPFPLGLDKFKWKMSPAEIRALSPFFAQLPEPSSDPLDSTAKIAGYRWQDCTFAMELSFIQGLQLDLIQLKQHDPSPSCIAAAQAALTARFGAPQHSERNGYFEDYYPYKDGATGKLDFSPTQGQTNSGLWIQFFLPPPAVVRPPRPAQHG